MITTPPLEERLNLAVNICRNVHAARTNAFCWPGRYIRMLQNVDTGALEALLLGSRLP